MHMKNDNRDWANRMERRRVMAEVVTFVIIPLLSVGGMLAIIWGLVRHWMRAS